LTVLLILSCRVVEANMLFLLSFLKLVDLLFLATIFSSCQLHRKFWSSEPESGDDHWMTNVHRIYIESVRLHDMSPLVYVSGEEGSSGAFTGKFFFLGC
jgi:hypothetical protein